MNTKGRISALMACWLLGSLAVQAEEAPGTSDTHDTNYRFTLTYTSSQDEEQMITFVAASRTFTVSNFRPEIEFNGRIVQVDKRSLVLEYNLQVAKPVVTGSFTKGEESEQVNQFQTMQRRIGGLRSSIRLRFGSPIIIFEAGQDSARLEVTIVD